jgi:hypothetical protein
LADKDVASRHEVFIKCGVKGHGFIDLAAREIELPLGKIKVGQLTVRMSII